LYLPDFFDVVESTPCASLPDLLLIMRRTAREPQALRSFPSGVSPVWRNRNRDRKQV
jgi:hypothetical protein